MKHLYLTLLALCSFTSFSQTTAIPDSNFEQALIDIGLDTGTPDGTVPTMNIDTLTLLHVGDLDIADLSGIEDFTSLEVLICGLNPISSVDVTNNLQLKELIIPACQLTSLDLSSNPLLEYLYCSNNQLTSLDCSNNPLLFGLECQNNQINNLNISMNTELYYFDCGISNQLTQLDLSHCDSLSYIYCDNNQLQCLNVKNGNNTLLTLEAFNNPGLSCIEVDDPSTASATWTDAWGNIDPGTSFSSYCGNSCTTSVNELAVTEREIVKVFNLMGQEVKSDQKGFVIQLYNDGSSERVFILE